VAAQPAAHLLAAARASPSPCAVRSSVQPAPAPRARQVQTGGLSLFASAAQPGGAAQAANLGCSGCRTPSAPATPLTPPYLPPPCPQVRDWYVESFRELRSFPKVKDAGDELQFTRLLQHIYRRHTNVVPVMAMGVAGASVAAAGRGHAQGVAQGAEGKNGPAVCSRCVTVRRMVAWPAPRLLRAAPSPPPPACAWLLLGSDAHLGRRAAGSSRHQSRPHPCTAARPAARRAEARAEPDYRPGRPAGHPPGEAWAGWKAFC
jgi:hypothetical protein